MNFPRSLFLGVGAAVAFLVAPVSASAADTLSASELSAVVSGRTWTSQNADGEPFWVTFSGDGTFCLKVSSVDEGQPCALDGAWWLNEDRYCIRPASGEWEQCLRVADNGNEQYASLLDDDSVDFIWSIVE